MVGCMGTEILPLIQPLMTTGLLSASSVKEVVDFLPFVGLVVHRYKPAVRQIIDLLFTPLVERIFILLNQSAAGTDDLVAQTELRRAYLSFLVAILNADLDVIFISDGMPFLS